MPLCAGRGWGVECASALGRGPVSGGLWPRIPFEGNSKGTLEFPSKGIRRELEGNSGIPFEGNSKGTRRVLGKYYASCRAHPATMRTVQNLGLGGCKTWSFIGTTTTGSSLVHCKLCCISSCARNVHFHNELPCDPHTQPRPPPARVHHSYRWQGEGRVLIWPSRRSRRS